MDLWILMQAVQLLGEYIIRTDDYEFISYYNFMLNTVLENDCPCFDPLAATTWKTDGSSVDDGLPF